MKITVDTTVTFELTGDRVVTVDALELEDWIASLWETKGADAPDGIDDKGNPKTRRTLSWDVIQAEFTAWVEAQTKVKLRKSEVMAIWKLAPGVWAKKNASWDAPEVALPNSPTSPPSTDPRFAED